MYYVPKDWESSQDPTEPFRFVLPLIVSKLRPFKEVSFLSVQSLVSNTNLHTTPTISKLFYWVLFFSLRSKIQLTRYQASGCENGVPCYTADSEQTICI